MAKRKIHFMNSALSIPRTFSCALDTFLVNTSCLFFSTFIKFSCENWIHGAAFEHMLKILLELLPFYFISFMFSTGSESQYYCKCNVNRLGQSDRDRIGNERSRSTNRISFYYNAWMSSLSPKGGMHASECNVCSEKFLFLYENFQIDSNNQTC